MNELLIVEDDDVLRGALAELFTREGYSVVQAGSASQARKSLSGDTCAVILDVGLPDGDGVSLCMQWRAMGRETPVLFLTARDDEIDVVRALDGGGNDYVTKPFRMQELLSRVRVLLRGKSSGNRLRRGCFSIDESRMQILRDGEALGLTLTEYKIVKLLLESRGITPRGLLLDILWDAEGKYIDDNTLSVHISRLREKVGAEHIKTVRSVGYQWVD